MCRIRQNNIFCSHAHIKFNQPKKKEENQRATQHNIPKINHWNREWRSRNENEKNTNSVKQYKNIIMC